MTVTEHHQENQSDNIIRLTKALVMSGIASRHSADKMIADGRVVVNGEVITDPTYRIDPDKDHVKVDDKKVKIEPIPELYFMMYKPKGCLTTMRDDQERPVVMDYLRKKYAGLFPVGRLDFNTEGALLLTNNGELANQLIHPRFKIPKVYLVKVKGIPEKKVLEKLRKGGIHLEDGKSSPIKVRIVEELDKNAWLLMDITEGRYRFIRRVCQAVRHPVISLKRLTFAGLTIEGLEPGQYRALATEEIRHLKKITSPE
jgi:pseudouridine synthase